jgi:hypothetical protein
VNITLPLVHFTCSLVVFALTLGFSTWVHPRLDGQDLSRDLSRENGVAATLMLNPVPHGPVPTLYHLYVSIPLGCKRQVTRNSFRGYTCGTVSYRFGLGVCPVLRISNGWLYIASQSGISATYDRDKTPDGGDKTCDKNQEPSGVSKTHT